MDDVKINQSKFHYGVNIAIDIRSLLEPKRTGVGEYTFELLDALFKIDKPAPSLPKSGTGFGAIGKYRPRHQIYLWDSD